VEHNFDFDGDGITKGIVGGIGAFLGAAAVFINNEIDDCDIGIMLGGSGSLVRPNGSATDIGALEFGSGQTVCIPRFPAGSTLSSSD
jgi:hypothetical protein